MNRTYVQQTGFKDLEGGGGEEGRPEPILFRPG